VQLLTFVLLTYNDREKPHDESKFIISMFPQAAVQGICKIHTVSYTQTQNTIMVCSTNM